MVKDRESETGILLAVILGGVKFTDSISRNQEAHVYRTDFPPELSHETCKVKVPRADDLIPSCFPAASSPRSVLHMALVPSTYK